MNMVNRSELKKKYGDEEIFVLHVTDVNSLGLVEGFNPHEDVKLDFINRNGIFVSRWLTEFNPTFKQPIIYAVLVQEGTGMIYGTRRLNNSGEARLVGNISIGIGGHVNPCDAEEISRVIEMAQGYTDVTILDTAFSRELNEEMLVVDGSMVGCCYDYLGFINDNSNDVGKDHLGVVVLGLIPANIEIAVKEVDKLEGRWYTIDELTENYDSLENWSKIALDCIRKEM